MAVKDKLVNLEDLKVVNDDLQGKCSDLNSAIDESFIKTGFVGGGWTSGRYRGSDGAGISSDETIKNATKIGLSDGVVKIICDSDYWMYVSVYDSTDTYIGIIQTDGTIAKSENAIKYFKELFLNNYPTYKFRICLGKTGITTAEGSQHCFLNYLTDTSLTLAQKSADAKTTGDSIRLVENSLDSMESRLSYNTNMEFTVGPNSITSNTNIVNKGSSTSWKGGVISVKSGEQFRVITTIYGSTYYAVIFTNSSDYVLAKYEVHNAQTNKQIDITVTAPDNATKMYVNYRINETLANPSVVKRFQYTDDTGDAKPQAVFRITSVNCGTFDHYRPDGGNLNNDQYKENWRKTINKTDFDFFVLVDCPFLKTGTIYVQDDLFKGKIQSTKHSSDANDQFIECRYDLMGSSVLFATESVTVDGVTYTNSNRRKFLRSILSIGSKRIAIYAIHATPELASGYAYLREAQFSDLLTDAQNYDGFIMCGDFNCQNSSEYDIFKTAGCNMGNCEYLGTFNTLRDIPADNIITSSNIIIREFELQTDYELNSDHYPVSAIIQFIG